MELNQIITVEQYNAALERFEQVFHAAKGTKESSEADELALRIKDHEEHHFTIPYPDTAK